MANSFFNTIVKIILMVCSSFLAAMHLVQLILYFTDESSKPFVDIASTIKFILILMGFILSALAFIGAIIENACLNNISLSFCFIMLLYAIWLLIKCFLNADSEYADHCETQNYVIRSLIIFALTIMLFAICAFISSIEG